MVILVVCDVGNHCRQDASLDGSKLMGKVTIWELSTIARILESAGKQEL